MMMSQISAGTVVASLTKGWVDVSPGTWMRPVKPRVPWCAYECEARERIGGRCSGAGLRIQVYTGRGLLWARRLRASMVLRETVPLC
jgi:hypothetical protein